LNVKKTQRKGEKKGTMDKTRAKKRAIMRLKVANLGKRVLGDGLVCAGKVKESNQGGKEECEAGGKKPLQKM